MKQIKQILLWCIQIFINYIWKIISTCVCGFFMLSGRIVSFELVF